jgi:hypothetical protein
MILCRDVGECIELVSVLLKIPRRDPAEHAGKSPRRISFLPPIGPGKEARTDSRRRNGRHFFDTDDESEPTTSCCDKVARGEDGGSSRGAGIFDAKGGFHPKDWDAIHGQRTREVLLAEPGVEVPHKHTVDVGRRGRGVVNRRACNPRDQSLRVRVR